MRLGLVTKAIALAGIAAEANPLPAPVPVVPMGHLVRQPHKRGLLEIQVLGGQTFKIEQVSNPRFGGTTFKSGPMELFRAYAKFGVSIMDPGSLEQLLEILCQLGLLTCAGTGGGIGGDNGSGGGNDSSGGNGSNDGGVGVVPGGDESSPVDVNDPNFNGTLPDDLDNGDSAGKRPF